MTTRSNPVSIELTSKQRARLRDALSECHYMRTAATRQQIISYVRLDYPQISFDASADPLIEIAGIIDRCLEFGGLKCLECFLEHLADFEKKATKKMDAVWEVWNQICVSSSIQEQPPVPKQLTRSTPGAEKSSAPSAPRMRSALPERILKAGGEFHWDRDLWVNEFVDIVLSKQGKEDIRIVTIPAPPEADPDRFVQYLEAKCNELARMDEIGAPIAAVRLKLDERMMPHQIATRVLSLLASTLEESRKNLRAACEQINREWGQRERRPQLSLSSLAAELSRQLQDLARDCRLVILLHGFDESLSEDVRSWLLYTWLESDQYELQNVVVVLTGAPKIGLESLSRPPYILCLEPLPEMDAYELWEWAHEGLGMTWVTLDMVKELNKRIHGSAHDFYEFMQNWKLVRQFEVQAE